MNVHLVGSGVMATSKIIVATLAEWYSSSTERARALVKVKGFTKVRWFLSTGSTMAPGGSPVACLLYSADGTTWKWIDTDAAVGSDTAVGSHEPKLTPASATTTLSGEATLPAGLDTIYLALFVSGGDGATGVRVCLAQAILY